MTDIPAIAVSWIILLAVYLLFAEAIGASEIVVGSILASLLVVWTVLLQRNSQRRFAFSRTHFRPWAHALLGLAGGTLRTGHSFVRLAIVGSALGRARTVPFVWGHADAPGDRARRASALLAASLAPDSFVVCAEPDSAKAELHDITSTPAKLDPRWLVP